MVNCLDSESNGFDDSLYFDATAIAPERYQEVLKDIFYSLDQDEHYDMMESRAK